MWIPASLLLCLSLTACDEMTDLGETVSTPVVMITQTQDTLLVGETVQLTLSVAVSGVEWTSSADSVASVNYRGIVNANDTGVAVITATRPPSVSSCTIYVKEE